MKTPVSRYAAWKPTRVRDKSIWTRFKDGNSSLPTLILTHGPITSGPQLNPFCDALEERYDGRVLAIELPGQGMSDRIGRRRRMLDYANEIKDVLADSIGFDPAKTVFIGHCHGGDIMHIISQNHLVAGTVLLNPMATNSRLKLVWNVLKFNYKTLRSLIRKVFKRIRPTHSAHLKDVIEPMRYNSSFWLGLLSLKDVFMTWKDRAYTSTKNRSPTLLVTGEHDLQVPPKDMEALSRRIGNSSVKIIPDCGHMSILVQPDKVAEAVIDFVRQNSPIEKA